MTVNSPAGTSSSNYTIGPNTSSYTVAGTISDAGGIKSVTVNGSAATVNGNNWSGSISVSSSSVTTVTVVATDKAGRTSTVTRYVRGAYTVFSVTTESMENVKGDIVNWHSGRFSVTDNTMSVTAGSNTITCNRSGSVYVYMKGRNSTGVGNTCNLSLYKNGSKVGGYNHNRKLYWNIYNNCICVIWRSTSNKTRWYYGRRPIYTSRFIFTMGWLIS